MSARIESYLLLFISLVLTSCGAAAPEALPSPTPAPSATSTSLPPTPSPTATVTCRVNEPWPTPAPEVKAFLKPDPEKDRILGPEDAPVTIVAYADYQCPYCARTSSVLRALHDRYPEDVRLVYRHLPADNIHDKALLAVQAAEAAGLQGHFWAMHDLLYDTQDAWAELAPQEFPAWAKEQAASLGLDQDQFSEDFQSQEITAMAEEAWQDGLQQEISHVPFVRINYRRYRMEPTLLNYSRVVEMLILEEEQYQRCPPQRLDPAEEYKAKLKTEKGDVLISLLPEHAPVAVNSFLFLAGEDWYDRNPFYRVIPDYVVQTGDPSGTGKGNPGYAFGTETSPDLTFAEAGMVALANAGPVKNGSQFFITLAPAPHLNGAYSIFGKVIQGLDVLDSLSPHRPQEGLGGDLLLDVEIIVE